MPGPKKLIFFALITLVIGIIVGSLLFFANQKNMLPVFNKLPFITNPPENIPGNLPIKDFLTAKMAPLPSPADSQIVTGILREVNKDYVSVETWDKTVKFYIVNNGDPHNKTQVFLRKDIKNFNGMFISQLQLTSKYINYPVLVTANSKDNTIYRIEIFTE